MATAKKGSTRSAAKKPVKPTVDDVELEPDMRDQDPRPLNAPGAGVVVRAVGARSQLAWDDVTDVLGAAAAKLETRPVWLAIALVERIRFRLGGPALHARIDSLASNDTSLRVRGPSPVIEVIATAFRDVLRDGERLTAEIAKCDGEILRGWRPW